MNYTPAESELLAYTLAHRDPAFIHQYAVDAITLQRADAQKKPIAIVFALLGLYLHLEKDVTGRQVQQIHVRLAAKKRPWPSFPLPADRGALTAADVLRHPPGPERDQAIEAWCASVWRAYKDCRTPLIDLLAQHGIV
ncbi:MAG TPA: DUF5946 family protein [Lacunisphaera sp.]